MTWQLADALCREVYQLTDAGSAAADRRFRDDLRSAAALVANNTAEGFGRYRPRDFHRFLEIAKGSLTETEGHLRDGVRRGHFEQAAIEQGNRLVKRTTVAMTRLMRYLRSADALENAADNRR